MWMIYKILFCTQNFPRKTETVYNNVPRPKYFKYSWNSMILSASLGIIGVPSPGQFQRSTAENH